MALIDTPLCDFGWKAPTFSLADPHGIQHSFDDSMGENGLLVAFICNHCPYVKGIIDRIVMDTNELKKDGINTVAIMSNDYKSYPDDAPDKMTLFTKEHKIAFPYLVDETQEVGKAYGAVCTPDFFGFNNKAELQYRGRLDNLNIGGTGERTPDLLQAMQHVAQTGKGPENQTASMGCSIKWRA